jgi:transcriptional regulator with XRE-family HTH domain
MTFGSRLSQARRDKRLTQEQLGKGLGTDGKDVTKAVVSGWEKDYHSPRADQLAVICKRLGCSADYILFGTVAEGALQPDLAQLAAEIEQLEDGEARDWVMLNMREAVKIARKMPKHTKEAEDGDGSSSHYPKRSSSA